MLAWLADLEEREPRAYHKCLERILQLSQLGNEMRRPLADGLRDGIRELRARVGNVHYRILYFFYGSNAACLSHGIKKEGAVPDAEIETAIARKRLVEKDLDKHTAGWEE
jgi:phage-related protein